MRKIKAGDYITWGSRNIAALVLKVTENLIYVRTEIPLVPEIVVHPAEYPIDAKEKNILILPKYSSPLWKAIEGKL